MQEAPPMTEDMMQERQTALAALGMHLRCAPALNACIHNVLHCPPCTTALVGIAKQSDCLQHLSLRSHCEVLSEALWTDAHCSDIRAVPVHAG